MSTPFTLIRNANVYAPEPLGLQDVLMAGGKIVALGSSLASWLSPLQAAEAEVVDANGQLLIPGLVDPLVHISGGGGEGGFHTRTPAMQLTDATLGGVTTVIAALGTDATTRTLPDLLAKAYALRTEGMSAYCYTGSYEVPVRTITGSVRDDIVLIEPFIGVGEIAISDHRSSQPSTAELARIAADARVAGMLAGKAGITFVHVGDGERLLTPLEELVQTTELKRSQFYATHINRHRTLLEAGFTFAKAGGYIDFTTSTTPELLAAGEISAAAALAEGLRSGVPATCMSMSSDGNASLPEFNAAGDLVGLQVGRVQSLFESAREAVGLGVSWTDAVRAVATNAAQILKLHHKGVIAVGVDADVVLLNVEHEIDSVWARGELMVQGGQARRFGAFG